MNGTMLAPTFDEGSVISQGWALPRTGFAENFGATFREQNAPDLGRLYQEAIRGRYADAIAAIGDAQGPIGNPYDETAIRRALTGFGDPDLVRIAREVEPMPEAYAQPAIRADRIAELYRPIVDDKLRRAAAAGFKVPDPATFDREIAAEATALRQKAAEVGGGASALGAVGGFTGSAAGAMVNPDQALLTIATLPIGGVGALGAKTVLGRILATAATEAGLNAAQQAAIEAGEYGTRERLGTAPTKDEILHNILAAAAGGAVLGGGARGVGEAVARFWPGLRAATGRAGRLYDNLPLIGRDAADVLDSELQMAATGPGEGLADHAAGVQDAMRSVVAGSKPTARSSASVASGEDMVTSPRSRGFQARALASQNSDLAPPASVFESRTMVPSQFFGRNKASSVIGPSTSKVYHALDDVNALRQRAHQLSPILNGWLQDVVGPIEGAEVAGVRPKDADGINSKLAAGKRPDQISDYLGGRVTVADWNALDQVLRAINDRARVLYLDDFLEGGKGTTGYRAIHLQLLTKRGMSWELQIQPREIREVQGAAHAIYEKWRRRPDLTPEQLIERAADDEQARAMFEGAWRAWSDRNGPRPGGPDGGPLARALHPAGGDTGRVFSATGRSIDVRYRLAEADGITTSHDQDLAVNPDFPAELQPRDRARAASAAQVHEIAGNLEPERLTYGSDAGQGAPIVGPDDVVESGNGRVLAIRRAYDHVPERAALYRQHLESLGFDTRAFNRPVLVRSRLTALSPEERAAFVREANAAPVAAMSPTERAMSDAVLLGDQALELYRGGEIGSAGNRPFVRAFLDALPKAEQAGLVQADGALSKAGATRIQAAMLARAYSSPDLIAKLTESTDNNVVAIGQALTEAAPAWAQMRARAAAGEIAPEMDATPELLQAVNAIDRARSEGQPLGDLIIQGEFFGSGITETAQGFLRLMYRDADLRKPASMETVTERLQQFIAEANKTEAGANMFGQAPLTPAEILGAAADHRLAAETAQADMLRAAAPEAEKALDPEIARVLEQKDIQVPIAQVVEDGETRAVTKSARELMADADREIAEMQAIASCAVGGGEKAA